MLVYRVTQRISKHGLLQPNDTVIIGTSGGADSTALLHLLHACNMGLNIVAAYIDHGLRPDEAAHERTFLKNLTRQLGIKHVVRSIDVQGYKKQIKCSTEEAARILRYQALEEIRQQEQAAAVAVAHTSDDQVEEFFIRLIRGSGLKGISGMQYRRNRVIRPLLEENKQTLIDYLQNHDITFCEDSSNSDRCYLRNRVRLDLLPFLEQHFSPAIRQTTLQTASILRQDEDLLSTLCEESYTDMVSIKQHHGREKAAPPSLHFERHKFLALHRSLQRRLLEKSCWQMQSRPTFRQIEQLLNLIQDSESGAEIHLSHGLRVRREHREIMFFHPEGRKKLRGKTQTRPVPPLTVKRPGRHIIPELGFSLSVEIRPREDVSLEEGNELFLDADLLQFPLTIRSAEAGEKMQPLGAPGRKKISRILSDLKIPAHQRHHYPVIIANDNIAAIAGLKIEHAFRVQPGTTNILVLDWQQLRIS